MSIEQIFSKISAEIDINLENEVITYKSLARALLSIVEFLSFNRNQIPLVYQTFNHLTSALEKRIPNDDSESDYGVHDLALERQRNLAISTNRKFKEMNDVIIKSFKTFEIEQSVILFGATPFTAKEAFIVNLPSIAEAHLPENHLDSLQRITRKIVFSIISSTKFFDVNCTELKPTNMFIFLKSKREINSHEIHVDLEAHEEFRLPSNCRTTMINIGNAMSKTALNCCRDLNIFSEDDSLITSATTETIETAQRETEDHNNQSTTITNYFYECKVSVRGFKDQLVKGKSIWV